MSSFVRVGMELAQASDFSATLTLDEFAQNLVPLTTSPQQWAARQKTLSIEGVKLRRCKLGELCGSATVSNPEICARINRIASRVNLLRRGSYERSGENRQGVETGRDFEVSPNFAHG